MIKESERSALEERMAKVEGILEQMNARLNHLESDVSAIRQEISQLRAELHTDVRWIIGFVVGAWITLMLTLLFRWR